MPQLDLRLSLAVITIAIVLGVVAPRAPEDLPDGFDSPVVAMYMARDLDEVEHLVPAADTALRQRWTIFLIVDIVFAFTYGGLFCRLAWQVSRHGRWLDTAAAVVGAATSLLTVLSDAGENISIGRALDGSAWFAELIRPFSLAKWTLLGITALVISRRFAQKRPIDSERELLLVGSSFFYAVAAAIAFAGLFDHVVLERVTAALGVAIVLHTLAMWMQASPIFTPNRQAADANAREERTAPGKPGSQHPSPR